jgi:hypothetical protein
MSPNLGILLNKISRYYIATYFVLWGYPSDNFGDKKGIFLQIIK